MCKNLLKYLNRFFYYKKIYLILLKQIHMVIEKPNNVNNAKVANFA